MLTAETRDKRAHGPWTVYSLCSYWIRLNLGPHFCHFPSSLCLGIITSASCPVLSLPWPTCENSSVCFFLWAEFGTELYKEPLGLCLDSLLTTQSRVLEQVTGWKEFPSLCDLWSCRKYLRNRGPSWHRSKCKLRTKDAIRELRRRDRRACFLCSARFHTYKVKAPCWHRDEGGSETDTPLWRLQAGGDQVFNK